MKSYEKKKDLPISPQISSVGVSSERIFRLDEVSKGRVMLGCQIHMMRELAGFTIYEASQLLYIKPYYLKRLESGTSNFGIDLLNRMCKLYKFQIDFI